MVGIKPDEFIKAFRQLGIGRGEHERLTAVDRLVDGRIIVGQTVIKRLAQKFFHVLAAYQLLRVGAVFDKADFTFLVFKANQRVVADFIIFERGQEVDNADIIYNRADVEHRQIQRAEHGIQV